ncbi:MAG TPA: hypothetical protein VJ579_02275 [Candidatus Paceibacterota bacterium]|nr:hypothetical protein [Candidatus Paceibacterota bacterium]
MVPRKRKADDHAKKTSAVNMVTTKMGGANKAFALLVIKMNPE